MTAKAALAAAEAAGLRFTLAPDGRVVMTAAAEPPRDVVQAVCGQPLEPDCLRWLGLLWRFCRCDHNQISVGRIVRPWTKTL